MRFEVHPVLGPVGTKAKEVGEVARNIAGIYEEVARQGGEIIMSHTVGVGNPTRAEDRGRVRPGVLYLVADMKPEN